MLMIEVGGRREVADVVPTVNSKSLFDIRHLTFVIREFNLEVQQMVV